MRYTLLAFRCDDRFTCSGLQSTGSDGCCWLKSAEVSGKAPTVWQPYACSGYARLPTANGTNTVNSANATADDGPPPRARSPAAGKKNVLYLLVDDLRPDLLAYGQGFTHNPNIAKLAATGMVVSAPLAGKRGGVWLWCVVVVIGGWAFCCCFGAGWFGGSGRR